MCFVLFDWPIVMCKFHFTFCKDIIHIALAIPRFEHMQ